MPKGDTLIVPGDFNATTGTVKYEDMNYAIKWNGIIDTYIKSALLCV